ncbi:MAG: type II toxin-antitoxin system VapC family toxin [Candidatus Aenigmarchaeota archaeon]|nr:type II toxin-antitoxin system VapC family toxin [Candidatus Aenigmarchaeota archaeon]
MESNGLGWKEIKKFIVSLKKYSGLDVYSISLKDRIIATNHMKKFKLSFDDALCLQSMIANNLLKIVSLDPDFDKIPYIQRVVPNQYHPNSL